MTGDASDALPLSVRLWVRSAEPRFLIELNAVDAFEWVLANDLPALMEVLACWAPAIQGLAVAGLIADANKVDNHEHGTLIRLARQALGQS